MNEHADSEKYICTDMHDMDLDLVLDYLEYGDIDVDEEDMSD